MSEQVLAIIQAYKDKFNQPLPDDFDLRLSDASDDAEWIRVIQKAIDNNEPFEDEGIFSE